MGDRMTTQGRGSRDRVGRPRVSGHPAAVPAHEERTTEMARLIKRMAGIGTLAVLMAGVPAMASARAAPYPARLAPTASRPGLLIAGKGSPGSAAALPGTGGRTPALPASALPGGVLSRGALGAGALRTGALHAVPLRAGSAPLASGDQDYLPGVNFRTRADGWAVGASCLPNCASGTESTLIRHWNGTRWSRIASPSPGVGAALASVSAISPADAWAAGSYLTDARRQKTLILHWDGTRWSRVPSPDPGTA